MPRRFPLRFAFAALLAPVAGVAGTHSGEAALGYLSTDGNTQSRSVNAKLNHVYAAEPYRNTLLVTAISTTGSDDAASVERYTFGDKLDRAISERAYVFGVLEWEKDLGGAVRERMSEAIGFGRHVLTGPEHLLDLEIGAGARQEEQNGTGLQTQNVIGRASGRYEWKLSEQSRFIEAAKVEHGADNTFVESIAELRMPVRGRLAASLSYTVRHNTETAPGVEPTDTATAATLTWLFGEAP
jgi:putative salt-induced outer membrane protein